MTAETNWPKQDDRTIKETNIGILQQCMGLLYETHITEANTADARGRAIRAIDSMLKDLGHAGEITKNESIPWSVRVENSEIWKKDQP